MGIQTLIRPSVFDGRIFNLLTDVAYAVIPPTVSRITVIAYDATSDCALMTYVRVSAQPVHLASVRSLDRFLPDGTRNSSTGGWWVAEPPAFGFDIRALGVRMDSNKDGSIGADNTVAIQNCINTGFPTLFVPAGFARYLSQLTMQPRQTWRGVARNEQDQANDIGGSVLIFAGKAARSGGAGDTNEVAIRSEPGVHFTYTNFYDMSFWAAPDSTCTWIMRLYGANNIFFHNVDVHAGAPSILTGSAITITNIATGSTTTVTYTGTDPSNGQRIHLAAINGSLGTDLNDREFYIRNINTGAKTFRLTTIYDLSTEFDSSTLAAYTSGGTFQVCDLFFDTYGGLENVALDNTFVGGKIGQSCIQIVKNDRSDSFGQYHFLNCHYTTTIDRLVTNPGQDNYLGYGFALDIDYNDIHILGGHRNNATIMGRYGGGIFVTGGNSENTSKGSISAGIGEVITAGRALFVLRNKADSAFGNGHISIAGHFTGVEGSQGYWFAILDMSYVNSGICDCNVEFIGSTLRRNWKADIRLIGNTSGKVSGGLMLGCSTVDATGILASPRISIAPTNRDGAAVTWRGFTVDGCVSNFPDSWLLLRSQPCEWSPKYGSTTVDARGVDITAVGTPTGVTLASTNVRTGGGPRVNLASVATAGSAAEYYGNQRICWRGDAVNKGGFWVRFRFSPTTLVANSRCFVGLSDLITAIPVTQVPSALTKCLGVGWDAGATTLKILRGSTSAGAPTDLGTDFPNAVDAIYDIVIWSAPFGNKVWFRIERIDVIKDIVWLPFGSSLPSATTLLAPHFYLGNDVGVAGAVAFDLMALQARLSVGDVFAGDV